MNKENSSLQFHIRQAEIDKYITIRAKLTQNDFQMYLFFFSFLIIRGKIRRKGQGCRTRELQKETENIKLAREMRK